MCADISYLPANVSIATANAKPTVTSIPHMTQAITAKAASIHIAHVTPAFETDMTVLYNCRHSGDQYRIAKFIDGNPEASYLCTHSECQCPAGIRDTCRHRLMLPHFLNHNLVDSALFLNWDRGRTICDINGLPAIPTQPHSPMVTTTDFDSVDGGSNPPVATKPAWRRI